MQSLDKFHPKNYHESWKKYLVRYFSIPNIECRKFNPISTELIDEYN